MIQRSALLIILLLTTFSLPMRGGILDWMPFVGDDGANYQPLEIQEEQAGILWSKAQGAENAKKYRKAIGIYKSIFKKFPGSSHAPRSHMSIGRIFLSQNKPKKAFKALDEIILNYPDYIDFNLVIQEQFEITTTLMVQEKSRFLGIIPYNDDSTAIEYFESIVRNAPFSEYAPLALMNIALIHQRQDNVSMAIDAYDRLINNFPRSMLAPDAYLKMAETYASIVDGPDYDQGATREAISYYRDYLILYPENTEVSKGEDGLLQMRDTHAKSKFVIGEYYYKYRNNKKAAIVFLNEAITIAPDSAASADARKLLAEINDSSNLPAEPVKKQSLLDKAAFWKKKQSTE